MPKSFRIQVTADDHRTHQDLVAVPSPKAHQMHELRIADAHLGMKTLTDSTR